MQRFLSSPFKPYCAAPCLWGAAKLAQRRDKWEREGARHGETAPSREVSHGHSVALHPVVTCQQEQHPGGFMAGKGGKEQPRWVPVLWG